LGRARRIAAASLLAVATTGLVAAGVTPAGAIPTERAATTTIADWWMNENRKATILHDHSGNGANGTIGKAIVKSVRYDGAKGFKWKFASPTNPPAKPNRLALVWDNDLNPGSGDYAVEMRYRTKQPFGNIIQKGQGGAKGGYFKIENPNGQIKCVFRGTEVGGFKRKVAQSPTPINDNRWHIIRCEREGTTLTLTVDGKVVKVSKGSSGNIWNTRPISIGGKYNCDQIKTTCDYFTGEIDWIKIEN
jgi:hypothetical protein